MKPTLITWILVAFGAITLLPLFLAQFRMLSAPHGKKTRDLLIGEGESWRDDTHFRLSKGAAWADWLFFLPLFPLGVLGITLRQPWGYMLFGVAGAMSLYINIILWVTEKKYVYPSRGALRYFTYYWGFFVYWGALALAYATLRLSGIAF